MEWLIEININDGLVKETIQLNFKQDYPFKEVIIKFKNESIIHPLIDSTTHNLIISDDVWEPTKKVTELIEIAEAVIKEVYIDSGILIDPQLSFEE